MCFMIDLYDSKLYCSNWFLLYHIGNNQSYSLNHAVLAFQFILGP